MTNTEVHRLSKFVCEDGATSYGCLFQRNSHYIYYTHLMGTWEIHPQPPSAGYTPYKQQVIAVQKVQQLTSQIGLSSVLRPRQHSIRLYRRRFLQVKRPNQQYQSTEGTIVRRQIKHTISRHEHKTQQVP